MLTPAQVRSAWPLVTDATDAQLTVALANAVTVVATDLGGSHQPLTESSKVNAADATAARERA